MQRSLRDLINNFMGTNLGTALKLRLQARPQLDQLEEHEAPAIALPGPASRRPTPPPFGLDYVPALLATMPAVETGIAVNAAVATVTAPGGVYPPESLSVLKAEIGG